MHRKVAAVVVAALALGLASCGGSEPVLTRAQLTSKIAVACRQALRAAQRELRANANDRSGMAFIKAVLADQHAVMDRIKHFNPPAAAKADFEAFKQGVKQRLDLVEGIKGTSRAGAQRAIASIQRQGEAISRRVQVATRHLGVDTCI